mmetsp:Transcript_29455/g.58926  ORF Transcript_29455/g.58926 Transcript_29455/m.58926 type:complete len:629 (-) Transcript_29455:200-2086(-)
MAILFTQTWVPYTPHPEDFDYKENHPYNKSMIIFLQRNIQGILESILLIPTILLLFILQRLWSSVKMNLFHDQDQKLDYDTLRLCILAVTVPLCLNWIHFRCHDNLVNSIQSLFGWEHNETIAAIRMVFHIPAWILSIFRTHYFRLLTEQRAGWPSLGIIETICPGKEIFPFAMIFLYRASEGMTIALLPSFFQGGSFDKFYLDLAENMWVAVTVLGMFLGNAVGSVGLGFLMQKKSYHFTFKILCISFLATFAFYMIPMGKAAFLALRTVSAILFPGPVVLSKITQNTRQSYRGVFKHIPMATSLVWFNQGFWFGGIISNSSVWTPWNIFFSSAVILFAIFLCLFIAFLLNGGKQFEGRRKDTPGSEASDENEKNEMKLECTSTTITQIESDNMSGSGNVEDDPRVKNQPVNRPNTLLLARFASLANGASFACHISLLPVQVTSIANLDFYEYSTIVASLGGISTILILLSVKSMSEKDTSTTMAMAYLGHMIGTAILCIPQIYTLATGAAVSIIVTCYGVILLSFFVMNLSCEVSLGQKSLKRNIDGKDAAAGLQMGLIKSFLSIGKVGGAALVAFTFSFHPQLPLWTLEGLLVVGASLTAMFHISKERENGVPPTTDIKRLGQQV